MPKMCFTIKYGDKGQIHVHEQDYIQRIMMSSGSYEPEVWMALAESALDREILWDVGANIGCVSVLAQQDSRFAQVHAFEPQLRVLSSLRSNIAENSGAIVKVHEYALGDQVGEVALHLSSSGNTGKTSLDPKMDDLLQTVYSIDCLTIDEVIDRELAPPPTMMKIDVEGWETHVIRGGSKLFMTLPPRVIVFESPYNHLTSMPTNRELVELLETYGYGVRHIRRLDDSLFTQSENFIATRTDPHLDKG